MMNGRSAEAIHHSSFCADRFHGTVRKPVKRPSSNLGERLWVRLPPVLLEHASAGHRRAPVAVTHPPSGCAGSTPARRTLTMARSSNGRMLGPQPGDAGSIPVRATEDGEEEREVRDEGSSCNAG